MAESIDIVSLVTDHQATVYRFAYRLCGAQADAEDVTQETFLTAQQNLGQLRDPEKARSWLLAIARTTFLKSKRRRRPVAEAAMSLDLQMVADTQARPVDSDDLQQALAELPEEFRLVVLMFYFEFRSYREIAAELDLPIGTVMSRLSRAKSHLRRRLSGQAETSATSNGEEQSARGPATGLKREAAR